MFSKLVKIALFCFTFFPAVFLEAQENKIVQVKGVTIRGNNEALPYAFIYDVLGKKGYLADEHGEFNLFVERGTTLLFSYIGCKREKFSIPQVGNTDLLFLKIRMTTDTLILPEVLILQWKTYKQFIRAVVAAHVPEDDVSRAQKKFFNLKRDAFNPDYGEYINSSMTAYRLEENQRAADAYWKGQTQPMQIFNLMAWEKFIEYLKEGKFKNPNKNKDNDSGKGNE